MQFALWDGFTLFVPVIFPSRETLESWPSFKILYATEIGSIVIALPGFILLIRALDRSVQLFHKNLIRVMQVHLITLAISVTSRFVIAFYDLGFIYRKDIERDMLLFLLLEIRFASLCSLTTVIPAMVVERTFASRFVSIYERIPKPWISYLVNIASLVLGALIYFLCSLAASSLYYLPGLLIIVTLIKVLSTLVIKKMHHRNMAILNDITNATGVSTINYTLSLKFQLAENARVTKLLLRASFIFLMFGMMGSGFIIFSLVVYGSGDKLGQLLYALFNNFIAICFTVLVWWTLVTLCGNRRLLASCGCCSFRIDAEIPTIFNGNTNERTEEYFAQLRSLWAK